MADKWVKPTSKRWLGDYTKPKRERRRIEEESKEDRNNIKATITHVPLRCPGCRSRSVRCYGADRPVLYYKCQDCDLKFKVYEVEEGEKTA